MKTILSLIKIAIIFGLICGCFFLLINQTFIYEVYKGELMEGDGITIPRFLYFVSEDNDLNVKFYTPLSKSYITSGKDSYLNNLTKCYGKYYFDEDNNITITKYNIIDNSYYREITISYVIGNYCSDDYVLSDMWVYEYNTLSTYINGDISATAMNELINKIYNSSRINDPEITDYKSQVEYKVTSKINGIEYEMYFSDFSANELLVIKKINNEEYFGVYQIENVVDYLKNLEK